MQGSRHSQQNANGTPVKKLPQESRVLILLLLPFHRHDLVQVRKYRRYLAAQGLVLFLQRLRLAPLLLQQFVSGCELLLAGAASCGGSRCFCLRRGGPAARQTRPPSHQRTYGQVRRRE